MKDWIAKNIEPPGMKKKNRGSLFSVIGRVFGKVRDDAEKAFKAHFPYLADLPSLRKHGKSLGIPEFPHDSEEGFRERVSAASFYLMKAGERSYIQEQLQAHFGDKFIVKDEFLKVFIKIADLSEQDFTWVYYFLDDILDPNILLTVAEWFSFVENITINEKSTINTLKIDTENYIDPIKYNGTIKYDGHSINNYALVYGKYNAELTYGGNLSYSGIGRKYNFVRPTSPFKYLSKVADALTTKVSIDTSGEMLYVNDKCEINIVNYHFYDGTKKYNSAIKYDSTVLIPVSREDV